MWNFHIAMVDGKSNYEGEIGQHSAFDSKGGNFNMVASTPLIINK